MKPIFFAVLMTLSFLAQSSRAAEPKMTTNVVTAFHVQFSDAQNAQWSAVDHLLKVTFTLDDQAMFAFYNADGDLVVSGKYLTTKQLPKPAQKHLAQEAKGYTITEVFVVNDGLDSKYFVSLENAGSTKVLASTGAKWNTFKTSSK